MQQKLYSYAGALILTLALMLPIAITAQSQFAITRFTLGGSAGLSTGGTYAITGNMTALNSPLMKNGPYAAQGSILAGSSWRSVYLPIVSQSSP